MIHIIPRKSGDGLIPMDEKLQDQKMIQDVKTAILPVLNQQLGIESPIEEPEQEEEAAAESDEAEEAPAEESPEPVKEEPEEKEEDVSLDDIADLFK